MKGMRSVKRGKGFRGVLNYVFGRDDEHKGEPGRLLGGNLSGLDPRTLAQEFGITRGLRPEVEKPVWHNSLRLPKAEKITDAQWLRIADEYMREMGFSDLHPRCYVLHDDNEGQHIHIVASRIALDGSLYLGKNENLISTRIIQQIEIDHLLTITKGPEYTEDKKIKMPDVRTPKKEEMEKAIRTGEEPPRQRLQRLLDSVMAEKPTAVELADYMYAAGVEVRANIASTGTMNGFSFSIDGVSFSGSKLGDRYKWSNLLKNGVSYDKDRDGEGLKRYRAATANSKVAGTDLSRGIADAPGVVATTGSNSESNIREFGTHGENGASIGSGLGYAKSDHRAIDTDSSGITAGTDADAFTGQSEAVSDDGEGAAQESDASTERVEALDARSQRIEGTKSRDAGTDSKIDVEVLDSGGINSNNIVDLDSTDFGNVTVTAWNSRFKKASAKRRKAKEQKRSLIKKVDYAQVRDAARMADLVSYMESVGLEVKKDGVKDWVVDDRYRVTQKPDGHFVWCTWDQSRGGDGIAFLRDEMGLTFEQAIADLSGSSITHKTKRNVISCDESISPPPRSKDRDAITAYLESRGISKKTVGLAYGKGFLKFVDYKGIPAAAFCGNVDGSLRSMTIRLTQPIRSFDGEKELTKLDVRHSDKSYPAIWKGDNPPSTVWIVEGGIDALAAIEWYRASKKPIPTIIVSGGAGVRSFLDRPHVQNLLKEADTVYVAMEKEKDQETQAKTDAAHEKQIDKLCDLGCEKVIAWMPPVGTKDLADAWKAGVLPDPHDDAHDQSDNSDDVLMLPNEVAEAVEAMAPVMRD